MLCGLSGIRKVGRVLTRHGRAFAHVFTGPLGGVLAGVLVARAKRWQDIAWPAVSLWEVPVV